MKFTGSVSWSGGVKIIIRNPEGRITEIFELPNLIMNVGLNMIRDLELGTISDGTIKYLALGNSSTAPAVTQTQLGGEIFRKAITNKSSGGTGKTNTITYVAPAESVGQINELGWFAGAGATSAPNSGIMIARVLWSRNKTNLESLQVERSDTVVGG